MKRGAIITLAWPEGMTTAAGAWYDKFFSKNGKYRVGHSALVMINFEKETSHYFDFGRYHTAKGYGRVRDAETDPSLTIQKPIIKDNNILNIEEILFQVSKIKETYGKGKLYASLITGVDFEKAFLKAKQTQKQGMVAYGPFIIKGTNCSRFVATVLRVSVPSFLKKLRFKYQFCISPSPKRNVSITNNNYYVIDKKRCIKVKKNKLQAYFTSIENYKEQ